MIQFTMYSYQLITTKKMGNYSNGMGIFESRVNAGNCTGPENTKFLEKNDKNKNGKYLMQMK